MRLAILFVAAALLLAGTACGERKEPTGALVQDYPVTVQGAFSRSDYRLTFNGVADPERLTTMFDALGLPLPPGAVSEGPNLALLDFELSGLWSGFAAPKSAGFVRLQSASLTRAGIKPE